MIDAIIKALYVAAVIMAVATFALIVSDHWSAKP